MKFQVSSTALYKQLTRIAGAIPTRSVLPIIENFLFDLNDDLLTIATTNRETSMQIKLAVESTGGSAKIALPAKVLQDILKALPEQPVSFEIDLDTFSVTLSSENGTYKIGGENGELFPSIPSSDGMEHVTMPLHVLLTAVNKTLFAASTDEDKAALNGIYFDLSENGATFVATDAHRLVRYHREDVAVDANTSFIVPQKALNLLKNSLSASKGDVAIYYNANNAIFQAEDLIMVCRLIDDAYPNYEQVIPKENPNKLFITKTELLGTLRRVNIFADKKTHQVRLAIGSDILEVSSEDLDFANEARERIPCHYEGDDIEIGFNASLLIEMISNMKIEDVILELSNASQAGIILPSIQEENENVLMLIMPIVLNSYVY